MINHRKCAGTSAFARPRHNTVIENRCFARPHPPPNLSDVAEMLICFGSVFGCALFSSRATLPLLLFYYLGCRRFPLRNNSLIYISIFPPVFPLRRVELHVAPLPHPPAPPSPTPGEQWHAKEIPNESLTPASYSCCGNSARYLLCAALISENCVAPRMECGKIQNRRRFSIASRQTRL